MKSTTLPSSPIPVGTYVNIQNTYVQDMITSPKTDKLAVLIITGDGRNRNIGVLEKDRRGMKQVKIIDKNQLPHPIAGPVYFTQNDKLRLFSINSGAKEVTTHEVDETMNTIRPDVILAYKCQHTPRRISINELGSNVGVLQCAVDAPNKTPTWVSMFDKKGKVISEIKFEETKFWTSFEINDGGDKFAVGYIQPDEQRSGNIHQTPYVDIYDARTGNRISSERDCMLLSKSKDSGELMLKMMTPNRTANRGLVRLDFNTGERIATLENIAFNDRTEIAGDYAPNKEEYVITVGSYIHVIDLLTNKVKGIEALKVGVDTVGHVNYSYRGDAVLHYTVAGMGENRIYASAGNGIPFYAETKQRDIELF